jgi:hypothetical protein
VILTSPVLSTEKYRPCSISTAGATLCRLPARLLSESESGAAIEACAASLRSGAQRLRVAAAHDHELARR